jgi:hypothetical protein
MWSEAKLPFSLAAGFIKLIDANERLRICDQQASVSPDDPKTKPQQILYDNSLLMDKISSLFFLAFGQELLINYRGGSVIPIHVGSRPKANLSDRMSDEYVAAVRSNPTLHTQGDGVRSYAGILFEAVVSNLDINLIDEPEAFLHPPQMRRIGMTLASEVSGQLFVASHSSDVLRGFLEGTKGDVRILRIRREGEVNVVFEAAPAAIQELLTRPELRYSNALEGIFHEQAILCEDDSDCRLFNAVADHLANLNPVGWPDTAYVPTGGKHGVKKVAQILRSVGVPVKAVFDIDVLSEAVLLKETVEAFGGDWQLFEVTWRRLDAEVRGGVSIKSAEEINLAIVEIVKKADPGSVPRSEIISEFKQSSSWNKVKQFGSLAIPRGDAQSHFTKLRNNLMEIGIYVIDCGEVENFCTEVGGHGPKFVMQLLSSVSLSDPKLEDLRRFVEIVHKGVHAPV